MSSDTPRQWMPREEWDRLVRGENCPLCGACRSTVLSDDYGHTIADLAFSRLRLARNQFVKGYSILICHKHVQEPYHLSREERARFFGDLLLAGQALDRAFAPVKMNFQLLGNAVPHLHVHIMPRYYGDAAPGEPIDPTLEKVVLEVHEYAERVHLIREALEAVRLAEEE